MVMNGIMNNAAGCGDLKKRIMRVKSRQILIARVPLLFLYL